MAAEHGKQFTLYASVGPNPWKIDIVLKELGLTYHSIFIDTRTGLFYLPIHWISLIRQ
jgi:glutathione S-transferase